MSSLTVIGRYTLATEIARGGMGSVYLGRLQGAVGFSRTVAIKRLHPQYAKDPEFVSMLLDEARLAARVRHTNVVPVLDVEAVNGELFLVMEYVHGLSIARIQQIARETGIEVPIDIACSFVVGALRGLHAAHEARSERGQRLNIVHRDVSPQNIIVGSDGLARVLDFGVAKASDRAQTTASGQIKGKLAYMAPEQVRGQEVSARTDVYAAAIVLWELLVGRRLFSSSEVAPLQRFVTERRVSGPLEENPEVPFELDRMVMLGMNNDPELRPKSAALMADTIEAVIRVASTSRVARWLSEVAQPELLEAEQLLLDAERHMRISERPPESPLLTDGEDTAAPEVGTREVPVPVVSAFAALPKPPTTATRKSEGGQLTSLTYASQTYSRLLTPEGRPRSKKRAIAVFFAAGCVVTLALAFAAYRTGVNSQVKAHGPTELDADLFAESNDLKAAAHDHDQAASPAARPTPDTVVDLDELPLEEESRKEPAPKTSIVRKPSPRPVRAPRPSTNSKSCNPPYTLDSRGVRHLKIECFK